MKVQNRLKYLLFVLVLILPVFLSFLNLSSQLQIPVQYFIIYFLLFLFPDSKFDLQIINGTSLLLFPKTFMFSVIFSGAYLIRNYFESRSKNKSLNISRILICSSGFFILNIFLFFISYLDIPLLLLYLIFILLNYGIFYLLKSLELRSFRLVWLNLRKFRGLGEISAHLVWLILGGLVFYYGSFELTLLFLFLISAYIRFNQRRVRKLEEIEAGLKQRLHHLFSALKTFQKEKSLFSMESFLEDMFWFIEDEFSADRIIYMSFEKKYEYFHAFKLMGFSEMEKELIKREKLSPSWLAGKTAGKRTLIHIGRSSEIFTSIDFIRNIFLFLPGKTLFEGFFIISTEIDLMDEREWFSLINKLIVMSLRNAELYSQVSKLAVYDGLTGLMNARTFREKMSEEFKRSERYGKEMSFAMIDIDHFKSYNDTNGHEYGNVTLKKVAQLLRDSVREVDLVFRYGGEEFCCILPETGGESAALVLERIRRAIEVEEFYNQSAQPSGNLTVSIGCGVYPCDAVDIEGLIEKADSRLYIAKENGRNMVVV